jgi:translation initiation factor 2 gamma subunit (eIF-2gamma)
VVVMKRYLVAIPAFEDHSEEIRHGICSRLGFMSKHVTVAESPFCVNCKEQDCEVSFDGTCKMVRVYLSAKKRIEPKI